MELPYTIDLKGRTAVITGGGGVLCAGFAAVLSECGANVALLDIDEEAAKRNAEVIDGSAVKALGIKADVTNRESLLKARRIVNETFGPCDILINGAGGNNPKGTTVKEYYGAEDSANGTFFELDPAGMAFVFNLNFLGTFLASQVFGQDMANKQSGVIVNISSMNAYRPLTRIPAYSAAKAAVSNFTQWLAVHFSRVNIRVNAIAPGFFETNQTRPLYLNPDGTYSKRAEKILSMTPFKRFGKVEDLFGTLLWLISDKASGFVNGAVIPVDGGFNACSGV